MCRYIKALLSVLLLFTNCQSPTNPKYNPQNEIVSIAYLKTLYRNYPLKIDANISIVGILRSDDSQGNFRNTFVIEDDTGGIDIKIELKNFFAFYPRGRKYTVRCNGLTMHSYGGLLQLGYFSAMTDAQIEPIPTDKLSTHILSTSDEEYGTLPTMVEIDNLSSRLTSCWIGLEPVQFIDEELDMAWADDDTDTDRHLINHHGDTLIVRTNHEAQYAKHIVPRGSGHIEGLLGYFNQKYQLRLTTLYYVILTETRFTPEPRSITMCSRLATSPTICLSAPECDIH